MQDILTYDLFLTLGIGSPGRTRNVMALSLCRKYKSTDGYRWLCVQPMLDANLNKLQRMHSQPFKWLIRVHSMWKLFIEPKKVVFAWSFILGGLPLG